MAYYVSPNNGSNGSSSALLLAMSNGSGTVSGGTGTVDGEAAGDGWIWDDATWILCASFIIFTMQTGWLRSPTYRESRREFRTWFVYVLATPPNRLLTEAAPTSSTYNLPYSPSPLPYRRTIFYVAYSIWLLYFSVTLTISRQERENTPTQERISVRLVNFQFFLLN